MRQLIQRFGLVALVALVAIACHSAPPAVRQPAPSVAAGYNPARDLGTLFHDVQMARVFSDSKTFVDARPKLAVVDIVARYSVERGAPGFNLKAFVDRY